ncbi:hypothetical protein MDS_2811 [Ectopseudomonas mendocina NK-01]|nr:hypothetical protein MDS_2811 [Pseudomonas mendocina NK-01]
MKSFVLLTELQSEHNAAGIGKKILKAMAPIAGLPLKSTCSLGISPSPRGGERSDILVIHADHAMY